MRESAEPTNQVTKHATTLQNNQDVIRIRAINKAINESS